MPWEGVPLPGAAKGGVPDTARVWVLLWPVEVCVCVGGSV